MTAGCMLAYRELDEALGLYSRWPVTLLLTPPELEQFPFAKEPTIGLIRPTTFYGTDPQAVVLSRRSTTAHQSLVAGDKLRCDGSSAFSRMALALSYRPAGWAVSRPSQLRRRSDRPRENCSLHRLGIWIDFRIQRFASRRR